MPNTTTLPQKTAPVGADELVLVDSEAALALKNLALSDLYTWIRAQLTGFAFNHLVNGGFEFAQRGAGPFTASSGFTLDCWQLALGGTATCSVTPETTTVDAGSVRSAKLVYTHAAGGSAILQQKLENYVQLRGQTVTFTMRVYCTVAGGAQIYLNDTSGTTTSAAHPGTGWATLTVTRTLTNTITSLFAVVQIFGASQTAYCDNAMLVIGALSPGYLPGDPAQELARCQRYYEVHGGFNGAMFVGGYNATGGGTVTPFRFSAPKGGTPTVTKNGTWAKTNCAEPTIATADAGGYSLQAVITATGAFSFNCNSTDDTITAEWNP